MIRMILLATAAIGLFACGEDTSNDNPLSTKPVEEKKASNETSVVRISGAENFEFEQKVVFGCVNDLIHIQTFTQSPKFSLYLPADVTPGTYGLADFNANSNVSYVPGKAVVAVSGKMVRGSGSAYGKSYFTNNVGEVVITEVPSGLGEVFEATIKGNLESKSGESISIDAELSLPAKSGTIMNCQY